MDAENEQQMHPVPLFWWRCRVPPPDPIPSYLVQSTGLEPATKAVWAFCSSSVGRDRTYVQLGNNADYCCRMPTNLTSSLPMTRWDQDTAFKRLTEFADQLPLPDMVGTFIWLRRSAMLLRLREPSGSIFCSIATLSLQGVCIAPYGPLRPS